MRSSDTGEFWKLLDQLCAAFNRPKLSEDNEGRMAFWTVLQDVQLAEVRTNVERIIRTASANTRFPKPAQLRNVIPDEAAPSRSASEEARLRAADESSGRMWDQRLREDAELATLERNIAICARVMVRLPSTTEAYADAWRDEWRYRQQRDALLDRRHPSLMYQGYRRRLSDPTLPAEVRAAAQAELA